MDLMSCSTTSYNMSAASKIFSGTPNASFNNLNWFSDIIIFIIINMLELCLYPQPQLYYFVSDLSNFTKMLFHLLLGSNQCATVNVNISIVHSILRR